MAVQLVLAEKEALRETRRRGWDLVLTAQQSGQEMEEVESEGEPMSAAEGSDGTEAEAATEGEAIAAKRVRR
jgi:head-tail adaptor